MSYRLIADINCGASIENPRRTQIGIRCEASRKHSIVDLVPFIFLIILLVLFFFFIALKGSINLLLKLRLALELLLDLLQGCLIWFPV